MQGRVLVTTDALYRRKVAAIRAQLPQLEHVILVPEEGDAQTSLPNTLDWQSLVDTQYPEFAIPPTSPEDRALLHFTSGTTGRPKGAIHVHEAVVTHHVTGLYALDLHDDDIFWCTADPGWVTGTSYGIIAPLTNGVTSVVAEAEFDAERWYGILAAGTRHRLVHRADRDPHDDEAGSRSCARQRSVVAAVPRQRRRAAQSGSGGVGPAGLRPAVPRQLVADRNRRHHDRQLRVDGCEAWLDGPPAARVSKPPSCSATPTAAFHAIEQPMVEGELALKSGWPSMMRGYLNEEERYRKCFVGEWYLTGDLAMRDADGYYLVRRPRR